MSVKKKPRSFGTHDGSFHADEVTACALLLLFGLIDESKVIRTRHRELLEGCEYVCDVGGVYDPSKKLFDHHQADYQGPMSGAGMILLYLKDQAIMTPEEYRVFHQALIKGVDDHDNGKDPQIPGLCTYSHVIANFAPIPYDASDKEQDEAYSVALHFSLGHLKRFLERYRYVQSCRSVVEKAMQTRHSCLIFEKGIPWQPLFFDMGGIDHPATFVIMPSGEHWTLRGIPPSFEDRMNVRVPLPQEWAGLLEDELKKVSGIKGAVFCHKGRFVSVWETREDALEALKYTLSQAKEK